MENCAVIDLFCGIGGLTHGFIKEGFNILAGYDLDSACRYAYEYNNKTKFFVQDVSTLDGNVLLEQFKGHKTRILIGCAPCQPFSTYSRKRPKDKTWELLDSFGRLVEEVQPEIVSMENVPELAANPEHSVFSNFVKKLEQNNYNVFHKIVDCRDYGVPQVRRRLVLLASKLGRIELIPATHSHDSYVTVRQTIQHLPPITAGGQSQSDLLHLSSRLSMLNQERIIASSPGTTWREWNESLIADCHKKASGKTYVGVYGRMEWDKPAPTITTQFFGFGNGRFGHPEQNRAISLREGALLQTFPENYQFAEPGNPIFIKTMGRHIGNSVPVKLGQIIALSIKIHLEKTCD